MNQLRRHFTGIVPVTIKRAYTVNIYQYQVDTEWTMIEFLINCKNYLSELTQINQENIEIIECGTPKQEDANQLIESDEKLYEIYTGHIIPSFYFRTNLARIIERSECPECIVCYLEPRQMLQTSCGHNICSRCYNIMAINRLNNCPMCRTIHVII